MTTGTATNLRTILIAEDDADDRELISAAFRDAGYLGQLQFAHDGRELLEMLDAAERAQTPPQLILLDLNMPRLDGRAALLALRSRAATCNLPVVILSTSAADADVRDCYRSGANSYCTKPLDFRGLVALARDIEHWWFKVTRLPPANG
jgi:CheY-like chemotaxis protein